MSAEPRVSIIIVVRAINNYIRQSLPHLAGMDYENFEVLIIPDEDTGEKFRGAKIIPSGRVGPAEKRDLGAEAASGTVLAFLDDDAYPRVDWLKNAVPQFTDSNVAALGGPAVTPADETFWRRASGAVYASLLGGGPNRYRYIPLDARDVDDFPSVNLLVRREIFLELGGFDSHYWPGEDTKLCRDIVLRGYRIVYSPDVVVWHHRRSLFRDHLIQVANYAAHRGLFARRLPETSRRLQYFLPSLMVLGFIVGIPSALYLPAIGWILAALAMLYGGLLVISTVESALRERSATVALAAAVGTTLTHLVYGLWFLRGLMTAELAR